MGSFISQKEEWNSMKVLVVFFTWKGHTERLAHALARKLGTEAIRIEPVVDPGKHIGRMGLKALLGGKAEIKPIKRDMSDIDHLVIATPVWSGNLPPYTRQYLSDLSGCAGKNFSVLAEMGGSGAARVIQKAREILEAEGMEFVASIVTVEKDVEEGRFDTILDEFAEKVQAG